MRHILALTAVSALSLLISAPSNAEVIALPGDIVPNFFGLAAGKTNEWQGSDETQFGGVPGGRFKLEGASFVELYGPYLGWNINKEGNGWEYGPVAVYRFGRDDTDIDELEALGDVDGGLNLGGYVGYNAFVQGAIPYRFRFGASATTGLTSDTKGVHVSLYGSLWVPLSRKTFVGFGGGTTWSDDDYMDRFFTVDAQGALDSGIEEFQADSGIRQIYGWTGILHTLDDRWLIGAGAFLQHLTNDAADSPIVDDFGDRNDWTYGIGAGYRF